MSEYVLRNGRAGRYHRQQQENDNNNHYYEHVRSSNTLTGVVLINLNNHPFEYTYIIQLAVQYIRL